MFLSNLNSLRECASSFRLFFIIFFLSLNSIAGKVAPKIPDLPVVCWQTLKHKDQTKSLSDSMALFPIYFYTQGQEDALIDGNLFLTLLEEQQKRHGNIDLFFLGQALLSYIQLEKFDLALRDRRVDNKKGILDSKEIFEQRLKRLFADFPRDIAFALNSPLNEDDDFSGLLAISIFFKSDYSILPFLRSKLSPTFLQEMEAKILEQLPIQILEGESNVATLRNGSFAMDSKGSYFSLHSNSKATDTLLNQASSMTKIFQLALLDALPVPHIASKKLAAIARHLLVYEPLALELAQIAIDQPMAYRSFDVDSAHLNAENSNPFPDLRSAYELLENLEHAKKYLEKYSQIRL